MPYRDKGLQALRHIGKMRWAGIGVGAYHAPHAVLTGTATVTPTEAEVIAGTQTLIITLSGAAWAAAGTAFDAERQNIINGLKVHNGSATGFELVKTTLAVTDVVRTSATVVTITLPATPAYKLTANETVYFEVPATALNKHGGKAMADVSFTVVNATPTVTAALTGTALSGGVLESEIVTGGQTVIITLTGSTWIASGGFNAVRQAIIDGMTAATSPTHGWNNDIKTMAVTCVVRTSNAAVTVTLPAAASYAITADETVTVTVPAAAIATADSAVVATPAITITNQ